MPGTWRECRAATDSEITSWRCLTDIRFTHVGGRAALIEVGGWRLLTDPTFDSPAGGTPSAGGRSRARLRGPAAADIGPIDAVLLSHDHHADNRDDAGRPLSPSASAVLTTTAGAKRLGGNASGLSPWSSHPLEAPGRPTIEDTATPCRHGRLLTGFALRWEGQEYGVLLDFRQRTAAGSATP